MTDPRIEAAARAIFAHYNPNDNFDGQFSYHKDTDFKIAEIAIAAADAAAWRPIEKAPKDGTQIIACGTQPSFEEGAAPEPFLNIICYSGNRWQDWTIADAPEPTHWQPLPATPASIAELGGVDG